MRDDVPLMFTPININIYLSHKCISYIHTRLQKFLLSDNFFHSSSSHVQATLGKDLLATLTQSIITSLYLLNCF
jgi:hypothetical protein